MCTFLPGYFTGQGCEMVKEPKTLYKNGGSDDAVTDRDYYCK